MQNNDNAASDPEVPTTGGLAAGGTTAELELRKCRSRTVRQRVFPYSQFLLGFVPV